MEAGQRPAIDFTNLTLEEVDALLDALESDEHDLSAKRRRAHERIDNLRADVRTGVESYPVLARLEIWERRLSGERRALHACIDALHEARVALAGPTRRPGGRRGMPQRFATLADPDAGRAGTLEHLPPFDRPLDERRTLGYGERRPASERLEGR